MKKKIYLSLAKISGHEIEYVTDAIESNWIVPLGPNVDGFEEDLERYLETDKQKVVALSSGTAAIHLALLQMGVGEGDEVICQSFTFTASANPIIYQHATPVFVDSEPDTWNMSPEHLRAAIEDRILKTGKKPKAIVIVHLFGMPAKMDEIMAIASEFGIPVLEDAAEALGAEYKGRRCGKLGDYGVLSFNGNKIITTSGGGALICPDEESAIKTKYYATQARENRPYYHHTEVGYNYRMSNISAGIGRGQMRALKKFVARRREVQQIYEEFLGNIPGITVHRAPSPEYNSNYWLPAILIDPEISGVSNKDIYKALENDLIESRPLWKPLHLQPVFEKYPFYGDGTSENLFEKGLCLPSGSSVTNDDLIRIINVIKQQIKIENKRSIRLKHFFSKTHKINQTAAIW